LQNVLRPNGLGLYYFSFFGQAVYLLSFSKRKKGLVRVPVGSSKAIYIIKILFN